jgi:zinc/manganese transport system permease protein
MANTNSIALDLSILLPAFWAGLLVLLTHVPLGVQVLKRGIVFIDLAIAQFAGVGVIAASAYGLPDHGWAVQLAAVSAALLGAVGFTWSEKRWPEVQEALIGVSFVLASCVGLLLLAGNPHGGEHLKDLLVGQILWVQSDQLIATAVLTAVVLALWLTFKEKLGRLGFYALFAISVTASVQLVGVYLVFSSLILPALAVRGWPAVSGLGAKVKLPAAGLMGVLAYCLGLWLSAHLDAPSGPVVVLVMAGLAVLTSWLIHFWKRKNHFDDGNNNRIPVLTIKPSNAGEEPRAATQPFKKTVGF